MSMRIDGGELVFVSDDRVALSRLSGWQDYRRDVHCVKDPRHIQNREFNDDLVARLPFVLLAKIGISYAKDDARHRAWEKRNLVATTTQEEYAPGHTRTSTIFALKSR